MTSRTIVRTQAELAELADPSIVEIDIRSERGVWLEVGKSDSASVSAFDSASVSAGFHEDDSGASWGQTWSDSEEPA